MHAFYTFNLKYKVKKIRRKNNTINKNIYFTIKVLFLIYIHEVKIELKCKNFTFKIKTEPHCFISKWNQSLFSEFIFCKRTSCVLLTMVFRKKKIHNQFISFSSGFFYVRYKILNEDTSKYIHFRRYIIFQKIIFLKRSF